MIRKNQSAFLKQMRMASGLTQKELAKSVGASIQQYAQWESGKAYIPAERVWEVAEGLFSKSEAANYNTFAHAALAISTEMSKDWRQRFLDEIDERYAEEAKKQ